MRVLPLRLALFLVILVGLSACATSGPSGRQWREDVFLYPNDHYKRVGVEVAEMDVTSCKAWAQRQVGDKSAAGTVAKNTLGGAALGAALGAAAGAIAGAPGTGAAIGATVGGGGGMAKGAMDTKKHDPVYKGYVEGCLREKGYEPAGWK